MLVLDSPQIVQETAARWKSQNHTIALVPTMGCLHAGHLELVKRAQQEASKVIVSIFVNPLQFGPSEDFEKYPRPLENDLRLLKEQNVDLVFTPTPEDLYPRGFSNTVHVGDLAKHLCGKSRPGHFDGVATVCLKLFNISLADAAVFGRKDYQQLKIITRMAEDLNLALRIVEHETVRESDGLAMSSRNRYLSDAERETARFIPAALESARSFWSENPKATVGELRERAKRELRGMGIDYLEIASETTLQPIDDSVSLDKVADPHLFLAVKIGATRLIDNTALRLKDVNT